MAPNTPGRVPIEAQARTAAVRAECAADPPGELAWRRQVAEGVRELLVAINARRTLEEMLDEVLAQAGQLLGSQASAVYLRTDQPGATGGELLAVKAARGLRPQEVAERLRLGSPITALAVQRQQVVACSDLTAALHGEPRQAGEMVLDEARGYVRVVRLGPSVDSDLDVQARRRVRHQAERFRAALAVPLVIEGHVDGALALYYQAPRTFADEDIELARAFTEQAAAAIENVRWHERAERRARALEALYRAEAMLHQSLRRDDVLQALVDVAADILASDKTSVLIWDERHEHLVVGAARGFRPSTLARMRYGPGESVVWQVATRGAPLAVEDTRADPHAGQHGIQPEGIRALLYVPIMRGGRVAGVFGVHACQPRAFTDEEQRVLVALAQQAARALDNAELFEREQQSRQRLEVALEAGRMGSWEWDARTNRVTWSPQLEAIHGRPPGTFAGTVDAVLADVHPDDLGRLRQSIAASLERGEHHVEYRIVWPDGSVHWIEAHGRAVRDETGRPLGLRGVCLESTRSRVFRALHDIAVAVGGVLEPADLARLVAERACELLGADGVGLYQSDESATRLVAVHSSDADALSPEPPLAPGEGAAGQAFVRGEPVAVADYAAWPHAGAWGRARAVAAALAVPLRVADRCIGALVARTYAPRAWTADDARTLSLLAAQVAPGLEAARLYRRTRDEAHERGRLLGREQESRERLEVALEAGRMGTWEWDTRTNHISWSPQLEAIHGFAPGAFGRSLEAYFEHLHPDDVGRVREAIATAVERGVFNVEYRGRWPDGGVHWFEARGRVVRDGTGRPVGMRGVCMDVTARKRAEEERAQLLERERAALEAKAALEERQKLARELHDSVSQALYGISLGAQTSLDALTHQQDNQAAVQANQYVLSLAEAGLAELRALIFELRPESLAHDGLVVALERHAAAARARHGLQVRTDFGPEPALPLATKEALYRIAQEALHNTVKHAHAHSVQLRLQSAGGAVVLEVADDGVGFDPRRAYPGHLGLTSIRERAKGIGGAVVIDSAPGQGTRVRVRCAR